jgi:hypothetical protein
VTEDMASQTTGRAPCAPRVLGLVLLFVMTRVRVKLNGSDAGVAVVIKDGWALPDFLNAAKLKLLSPDAAAAVDDNQVVLWLAGSDRVTDIEELEKDDVVFLALHGSPFKPVAPMSTSPPPLAPPLPPPATPLTNQPSPIIPAAIPNFSELGGSTPTAPLQAATAALSAVTSLVPLSRGFWRVRGSVWRAAHGHASHRKLRSSTLRLRSLPRDASP